VVSRTHGLARLGRLGRIAALGVAMTLVPVAAWAQSSPSPTPKGRPSSGLGSAAALVIFLLLVALIVFYRRRVMEPFSRRFEQRPPDDHPKEDHPGP
jgi:hypothetical protein